MAVAGDRSAEMLRVIMSERVNVECGPVVRVRSGG